MSVVYTTAVKNARMDAVTGEIGTAGKLEIGTAGMAAVLVTFPLQNPAAPGAAAGVLTLSGFPDTVAADTGGGVEVAAAARIRDSGDTDIITGLTVGTSGADINLDNTSIADGQDVTINSATITHAA